jgi:hypothetical protein
MLQSNSKIFTTTLFGSGTNTTAESLSDKNLTTSEKYLGSSGVSNMGTILPRLPSNQKIAKDN